MEAEANTVAIQRAGRRSLPQLELSMRMIISPEIDHIPINATRLS